MKKKMVLFVACFVLFSSLFPGVVTTFPDMAKPIVLCMNGGNIYISDQYTIYVYDAGTLKLIKQLCDKGEGPQQFKGYPRIAFTNDRLILYDFYKIIIYSKEFKLLQENNFGYTVGHVAPLEENFILTIIKNTDNNEYYHHYTLLNDKLEKIKDVLIEPPMNYSKYLITPYPFCRSWKDKLFISKPQKDFCIEVFNKQGERLYRLDKKLDPVKFEEKHREAYLEELKYIAGNERFEKFKARGNFKKPMTDYMPPINNFWVLDDKIYVKTYDITKTTEKYIIMDLKGNILKTLFLPKTKKDLLTFANDTFYYLEESEDDEGWVLYAVNLNSN